MSMSNDGVIRMNEIIRALTECHSAQARATAAVINDQREEAVAHEARAMEWNRTMLRLIADTCARAYPR